jgi:hypothetical protein
MCGMNGQTTNNDMYAWTAGLDGGRKVLGAARLGSTRRTGTARRGQAAAARRGLAAAQKFKTQNLAAH